MLEDISINFDDVVVLGMFYYLPWTQVFGESHATVLFNAITLEKEIGIAVALSPGDSLSSL